MHYTLLQHSAQRGILLKSEVGGRRSEVGSRRSEVGVDCLVMKGPGGDAVALWEASHARRIHQRLRWEWPCCGYWVRRAGLASHRADGNERGLCWMPNRRKVGLIRPDGVKRKSGRDPVSGSVSRSVGRWVGSLERGVELQHRGGGSPMQDRDVIFPVHRLGRIRLRATRYGVTRTSPYLGVACAARRGGPRRSPCREPCRIESRCRETGRAYWQVPVRCRGPLDEVRDKGCVGRRPTDFQPPTSDLRPPTSDLRLLGSPGGVNRN